MFQNRQRCTEMMAGATSLEGINTIGIGTIFVIQHMINIWSFVWNMDSEGNAHTYIWIINSSGPASLWQENGCRIGEVNLAYWYVYQITFSCTLSSSHEQVSCTVFISLWSQWMLITKFLQMQKRHLFSYFWVGSNKQQIGMILCRNLSRKKIECMKFGWKFHMITPPKFNSSPQKSDGWKMILSFWGPAYFEGRAVKLPGSRPL